MGWRLSASMIEKVQGADMGTGTGNRAGQGGGWSEDGRSDDRGHKA